MNEMLDSQLSAMFDDELPAAECELLARRLSRDDSLQSRWRHYALIGAAVRGEHGLSLSVDLAARVHKVVAAEAELTGTDSSVPIPRSKISRRAWQGVAGVGVAAGVAALSVLWLRAQAPAGSETLLVQQAAPVATSALVSEPPSGPDRYVVPATIESTNPVPTAELANYVVAHSEYSGPLSRRNLLSSLVASEPGTSSGSGESDETPDSADTEFKDVQKPK